MQPSHKSHCPPGSGTAAEPGRCSFAQGGVLSQAVQAGCLEELAPDEVRAGRTDSRRAPWPASTLGAWGSCGVSGGRGCKGASTSLQESRQNEVHPHQGLRPGPPCDSPPDWPSGSHGEAHGGWRWCGDQAPTVPPWAPPLPCPPTSPVPSASMCSVCSLPTAIKEPVEKGDICTTPGCVIAGKPRPSAPPTALPEAKGHCGRWAGLGPAGWRDCSG